MSRKHLSRAHVVVLAHLSPHYYPILEGQSVSHTALVKDIIVPASMPTDMLAARAQHQERKRTDAAAQRTAQGLAHHAAFNLTTWVR
jgi:hypothetical protein